MQAGYGTPHGHGALKDVTDFERTGQRALGDEVGGGAGGAAALGAVGIAAEDAGLDAGGELGEDAAELAVADHGLAADEGDVEGLVVVDEREDTTDERVASVIGELAEGLAAPEVVFAEGITAGTAERALARDFDGKHRGVAPKDLAPGLKDVFGLQSVLL